MKRWLSWVQGAACVAALLLGTPFAHAAPSMSGATGMIRIPSADVLRPAHYSFGYYYRQDHQNGVAALGLPAGLEVSAAVPWYIGESRPVIMNAKISLNQESLLIPALAFGVEDLGGRDRRSFYGVLSKALPFGLRIHVGAGSGRFDGMFGAVEKVLNPTSLRKQNAGSFPVTSLIVEMDGYKMNYGARLSLAHGLRLDAGWMGRHQQMYMGLTYTN